MLSNISHRKSKKTSVKFLGNRFKILKVVTLWVFTQV